MNMINFNRDIGDTQAFNAEDFPSVKQELNAISHKLEEAGIGKRYKNDIIISYLKDHSFQNQWMLANPELITLMLSGSLATRNIEALFESCRWNKKFREDYERFVRSALA